MIWDWSYALKIVPDLLHGLLVTVRITGFSIVLALVLGLVLALARLSRWRWLSAPATGLIEFIRSTPLLAQLYFLFYVAPEWGLLMSSEVTGVIGLGVHFATYAAEVYRAGIQSVPRGQWEAARALNLPTYWTWRSIVLPQAIVAVIPALGNYGLSMFKETTVLISISVIELLGTAEHLAADTYKYFEPLTLVGIIFLCCSYPLSVLLRMLERRIATGTR
jgi:polar amino acid transport system permease protein